MNQNSRDYHFNLHVAAVVEDLAVLSTSRRVVRAVKRLSRDLSRQRSARARGSECR